VHYNKIDFVGLRKKCFIGSIAVCVLGLLSLLIFGLNLGVDFSSGTTMDISVGQSTTKEEALELFEEAGFVPPGAPTIGGAGQDRVTVRYKDVLSEDDRNRILQVFENRFGEGGVSAEVNTVDAGMAREFGLKTILYVGIACIGIMLYVAIRFEWRFALAAIIALVHDAFITVGMFSIFRLEVNLPFVAAVLTIIGYSINDTIVIFDRVRENMRTAKLKTYDDLKLLVNTSIRQTFVRSVNTGLTVIFAAVCLLIFGSPAIRLFSLAMLIGLIVGIYSSIFIAGSLWMSLKYRAMLKERLAARTASAK
jgi:SecD/SecF fusion protein